MRVAIITETFLPKVDGIVKVTCLLLDHLSRRGIEALVIAPRYGDSRNYNAVPVHSLPSLSFPLYPEARLGFATLSLYRDLAAFSPDVAHLFHPMMTGIPTMAMLKWMDVPTVTSFHLDYARLANQFKLGLLDLGFTRPLLDELTRAIFNWADYSLAPSRRVQAQMRMAAGLPVVASRVGGVTDIVREGETGYTFDSGDISALAAGLRKIARSRDAMQQMGKQARAYAQTQSWEAMMDEVIEIYAALIAASARKLIAS